MLKDFQESSPGFEAVDGDGAMQTFGDPELVDKYFFLFFGIVILDPAIQPNLTDRGGTILKAGGKSGLPVFANLIYVPRVKAVGGDDPRVLSGELGNGWPILGAGAVDDCSPEGEALQL